MNRGLSHGVALCLLVLLPLAGRAEPSERIELANATLRAQVTQGMLEGADRHRIKILHEGIVFASRDDGLVASTGVAEFGSLTDEHLANGAVVGLTYYSGFGVTPGFYRVYVVLERGAPKGVAYLLDEKGRAMRIVTVTQVLPKPLKARIQFTVTVANGVQVTDFHNKSFSIDVTIPYNTTRTLER